MRRTGEVVLVSTVLLCYLHFEDSYLTVGPRAGGIPSLGGEEGDAGAEPRPQHGAGCPAVGWIFMAACCCMCVCWQRGLCVCASGEEMLWILLHFMGVVPLAAALLKGCPFTRDLHGKMVYNQWHNLISWASLHTLSLKCNAAKCVRVVFYLSILIFIKICSNMHT